MLYSLLLRKKKVKFTNESRDMRVTVKMKNSYFMFFYKSSIFNIKKGWK